MSRRRGLSGITPYRKKQKSGHQKRTAVVEPTPESLHQKARAQGVAFKQVNKNASTDYLDLLYHAGKLPEHQYKAGQKFAYLRLVTFGRQKITASMQQVIPEQLSSDDAPDRLLTDEEKAELRERQEHEYTRACHCLQTLGRAEFDSVQRLCIDGAELTWHRLLHAKKGLQTLADMWKL